MWTSLPETPQGLSSEDHLIPLPLRLQVIKTSLSQELLNIMEALERFPPALNFSVILQFSIVNNITEWSAH